MKKAILLSIVLAGTLLSAKPQSYPKAPGTIRLLTYNTHYCKGGYDPGEINESNVKKLAQVIKALDADVIALQELDSASQSRGNRYLLREIAEHTGIEYTDVYANAARFDKKGSIGCGALVRKNLPIVSRYIAYLPGDEPRAAIQLELEKFVFIATHSDLNNEKRRQGTKIICNDSREMKKTRIRGRRPQRLFPLVAKQCIFSSIPKRFYHCKRHGRQHDPRKNRQRRIDRLHFIEQKREE